MGGRGRCEGHSSQRERIRGSSGEDGGAGAGRTDEAGRMTKRKTGGTLGEILGQIMAVHEKSRET